jgi:hypothetical protein
VELFVLIEQHYRTVERVYLDGALAEQVARNSWKYPPGAKRWDLVKITIPGAVAEELLSAATPVQRKTEETC